MMRGSVQWAAVPDLAAHFGCQDLDTLIPLIELVQARVNAPPEV